VVLGGGTPVGPQKASGRSDVENQTQYDARTTQQSGTVADPLGIVGAVLEGIAT
jgi:hypothetical protein